MTFTYHFDLPGPAIWISHILIGLFLIYVGYMLATQKRLPPSRWNRSDLAVYISLIVLGVLALLYHTHIWYIERKK